MRRESRLTKHLIQEIETAIATGAPIATACAFVGVPNSTLFGWLRRAKEADAIPPKDRSQLQVMCVELRDAVNRAQGKAGMRLWMQFASAAGMTNQRPKSRTITQKVIGNNIVVDERGNITGGVVTEVRIKEDEKAPDWRAMQAMGELRFRDQFVGAAPEDETDEIPIGLDEILRELMRAKEQANVAKVEAIEAASEEVSEPEAAL